MYAGLYWGVSHLSEPRGSAKHCTGEDDEFIYGRLIKTGEGVTTARG